MSSISLQGQALFRKIRLQRGFAFGVIIIAALIAFETFNYSTTDYALTDLLGNLRFIGIRWATILAIAFCGIDFAGIARLFTPETGSARGAAGHNETWYLFGAWLLAATMNAMLTWWGVSLAILDNKHVGNSVISSETMLRVVPIFVAILVWLIRVLIIGSLSVAGDRLFTQDERSARNSDRAYSRTSSQPVPARSMSSRAQTPRAVSASGSAINPAPKPISPVESGYSRAEVTYHPLSMSAPSGQKTPNQSSSNSSLAHPGPSTRR